MKKFLKWWAIIAWVICLFSAVWLLFYRTPDTTNRMKLVERGAGYKIMVDTNTGICYMMTGKEALIMVDHDGMPYVENGWRDYD